MKKGGAFLPAVVILCLLGHDLAWAVTCDGFYRELTRQARRDFLLDEDKSAIRSIQNNSALKPAEKTKQIFTIVFDARLRGQDPRVVAHVRKAEQELQLFTDQTRINGLYDDRAFRQKGRAPFVVRPEELAESAAQYFMKIHELEHANQNAQMQILKENGISFSALSGKPRVKESYFKESGAMAIEWRYLQNIPSDLRKAVLDFIRSPECRLDSHNREFLVGVMEDSRLPLRQYLAAQRSRGRYSKEAIIEKHGLSIWQNAAIGIGATLVFGCIVALASRSANEALDSGGPKGPSGD